LEHALAALTLLAAALVGTPAGAIEPGSLAIETGAGARHRFEVEIVTTPEDIERGLMFRDAMAPDHGMLFDLGEARPVSFWMRNTRLPLDMLFIAEDGRIIGITPDAVPYSEDLIPSPGPVRAVLELNAGTAERLGIAAGDRVVYAFPAPVPPPADPFSCCGRTAASTSSEMTAAGRTSRSTSGALGRRPHPPLAGSRSRSATSAFGPNASATPFPAGARSTRSRSARSGPSPRPAPTRWRRRGRSGIAIRCPEPAR
jgi:uncharacterized membrane protein (UPF0127 family)